MKLSLKSLSHAAFNLLHDLPAGFSGQRLPGGEVLSAAGSFGHFCVQEFDGGSFVIRYSFLQTEEPFQLTAVNNYSGIHVVIMLRNSVHAIFQDGSMLGICESEFTILLQRGQEVKINFPANQQFISFEVLVAPSLAEAILHDFPELSSFKLSDTELPELWVNPPARADHEVRDHIHYLLNYSNREKWRRNYFKNRVWDIVWKLVATHLKEPAMDEIPKSQKEKAYAVQRLILDNLDKHVLTKELAQKVALSESSLKKLFAKIYNMGVHEYRIYERLKKAIRLIDEGLSVKEAAAQTGWRSADLIRAYEKVYGITPGKTKKKKKK